MEDRKGSPTWRRVWRFENEDYTQARLEPWICYGGGGGGDGPSGRQWGKDDPLAPSVRSQAAASQAGKNYRATQQQASGRVAAMKDLSGGVGGRHGKYVGAYAGAGEWKPPEKLIEGDSCFIEGVQVELADGIEKDVAEISVGDVVKTKDGEGAVVKVFHSKAGKQRLYGFNEKEPFVTEAHPFMTQDGWKKISEVKVGDTLYRNGLGLDTVESIESKDVPEDTPVFNFHVDTHENYYAAGYLVHNKQTPKPAPKPAPKPKPKPKPKPQPAPEPVAQAPSIDDMVAEMQAKYDAYAKQMAEEYQAMQEGLLAQQELLLAERTKTEEVKKKIKKKRDYGRLSLLSGSELGIVDKLGVPTPP